MPSWIRKRSPSPKPPPPAAPSSLDGPHEGTTMAPPKRVGAHQADGRNGDAGGKHPHAGMDESRFLALKRELHQEVISSIDLSVLSKMTQEQLRIEVRRMAEYICNHHSDVIGPTVRERLVNEVLDETFGLGPLEPLMRDPTVTDILINGPKTVYVERCGRLEKTSVAFHDNRH